MASAESPATTELLGALDDVERLLADRARRAENQDPLEPPEERSDGSQAQMKTGGVARHLQWPLTPPPPREERRMPVEKLNIPSLPEPQGFTHIAIATGNRMVFLAGLVAQDGDGNLVGEGDLAAQMEQAVLNVAAGLETAGAGLDDVAKVTLYIVDWDETKLEALFAGFGRAAEKLGGAFVAPTTLIPVPRLFEEGHLVEIDVTAVTG